MFCDCQRISAGKRHSALSRAEHHAVAHVGLVGFPRIGGGQTYCAVFRSIKEVCIVPYARPQEEQAKEFGKVEVSLILDIDLQDIHQAAIALAPGHMAYELTSSTPPSFFAPLNDFALVLVTCALVDGRERRAGERENGNGGNERAARARPCTCKRNAAASSHVAVLHGITGTHPLPDALEGLEVIKPVERQLGLEHAEHDDARTILVHGRKLKRGINRASQLSAGTARPSAAYDADMLPSDKAMRGSSLLSGLLCVEERSGHTFLPGLPVDLRAVMQEGRT